MLFTLTLSSITYIASPLHMSKKDPRRRNRWRKRYEMVSRPKKTSPCGLCSPNGDPNGADEKPRTLRLKSKLLRQTKNSTLAPAALTSRACSRSSTRQPHLARCLGAHNPSKTIHGQPLKSPLHPRRPVPGKHLPQTSLVLRAWGSTRDGVLRALKPLLLHTLSLPLLPEMHSLPTQRSTSQGLLTLRQLQANRSTGVAEDTALLSPVHGHLLPAQLRASCEADLRAIGQYRTGHSQPFPSIQTREKTLQSASAHHPLPVQAQVARRLQAPNKALHSLSSLPLAICPSPENPTNCSFKYRSVLAGLCGLQRHPESLSMVKVIGKRLRTMNGHPPNSSATWTKSPKKTARTTGTKRKKILIGSGER